MNSQIKVNLIDNTKEVIIKGNITEFICSSNNLTYLNLDKNKNLFFLHCTDCGLTTLNLEKNTNLQTLNCSSNPLSTLNLSINLRNLECSKTNLINILNIDKNVNLNNIYCPNNQFSLNTIIKILRFIGKTKIKSGYCNLKNNKYTDFTQPSELIEALNAAKANKRYIDY